MSIAVITLQQIATRCCSGAAARLAGVTAGKYDFSKVSLLLNSLYTNRCSATFENIYQRALQRQQKQLLLQHLDVLSLFS